MAADCDDGLRSLQEVQEDPSVPPGPPEIDLGPDRINGDAESQLTADDKTQIRSTWPLLSHDPYGIGARVFLRIFELAPDARRLFRFDEMSQVELIVSDHPRRPDIDGRRL